MSKEKDERNNRAEEDTSLFKFYAYGHAVEDKQKNSRMLKVFLSEINPMADGEVGFSGTVTNADGTDLNSNKTSTELRSENSIDCDYLPLGSNRATPPDIIKGEPILVYRYGDDRKYYWKETGVHEHLRKTETVIYRWAANPEGANDKPDNYYFLEVSTDRKLITFQTSKANKEPFAVTFQIDTNKGTYHLSDDTGNVIEADFQNKHYAIENSDKSIIEMTGDHIFAKNKTGSTVDIEGDHIFSKNNSGSVVDIEGDHIFAQNVTGTKVDLNAGNAEVNAPTETKIIGGGFGIKLNSSGIQFIRGA